MNTVMNDSPQTEKAVVAGSRRGGAEARGTRAGRRSLLVGLGVTVVALVAGLQLPTLVTDLYYMSIFTEGALLGIFALSVGFLAYRLNVVSLGHTAFYGGAAYVVAIGVGRWGWSLTEAFLIAVVVGTFLSVLIGALVVRTPGMSFLMLTLALGQALYVVSVLPEMREWTGSYDGLSLAFDIENTFFGIGQGELLLSETFWPIAWVALVFTGATLWLAGRSRFGTLLEAIRENEERARFSGYNTYLPRLLAFVLTGFLSSIGGALFALHTQFVSPDTLSFLTAGDGMIAAIVGGYAVLIGPVIGALLYTYANYEFSSSGGNLQMYVGLSLVFVLMFMPGGIVGTLKRGAEKTIARLRKGKV